jgi:hypothetical protein
MLAQSMKETEIAEIAEQFYVEWRNAWTRKVSR